ncbi:MAG: hypothetical protein JF626_00995 [Polaromonas sp.]|nr:hypothetical protein [Polaromonas sp.]
MMQSPPALPSVDGPQNWKSLQTGAPAGLAAWLFIILAILFMICSGGFFAFLGRGARDPWLSALLLGGGAFMAIFPIWITLWVSQHGSFNFDINQKTQRVRKWKTSLFLKRSFDEYAYDDFRAVRSVQKIEEDTCRVVVELLFKATKPALDVGRFNAIPPGASLWRRYSNKMHGMYTESPRGRALRQELAKLMGITDAGYFDREQ